MSPASKPRLAAAAPNRRTFDPWNSAARGHQRAENYLASSVAWRESRETKLQEQFRGGCMNDGGKRMYDLVGAGAIDEGVGYFMKKDGLRPSIRNGGFAGMRRNLKQSVNGNAGNTASSEPPSEDDQHIGEPEQRWLEQADHEDPDISESLKMWDGVVREEAICLEVKGRKRRRGVDPLDIHQRKRLQITGNEDENAARPRPDASFASLSTSPTNESDEEWDALFNEITNEEVNGTNAIAADDNEQRIRDAASLRNVATPTQPPTGIQTHSKKTNPSKQGDEPIPNSPPPCGQTNYSAPILDIPPRQMPSTRSGRVTRGGKSTVSVSEQGTTSSDLLQGRPRPIFVGLTMFLSGSTLPLISDHALRQLIVSHGGTVALHIARRRITHVVMGAPGSDSPGRPDGAGGVLSGRKLDQEMRRSRSATGGPGIRFVRVEWVLESVRIGKRQSEAEFAVGMGTEGSDLAQARDVPDQTSAKTAKRTPARPTPEDGPLTRAERAEIGSEEVHTTQTYGRPKTKPRATPPKTVSKGFQKSLARPAIMPAAPPGVPSIRSLFLKQHRDNVWSKAGFLVRK